MDVNAANSNPVALGAMFIAPGSANSGAASATQANPAPMLTTSPFEQQFQESLQRSSVAPAGAKPSRSANAADAGAEASDADQSSGSTAQAGTTPSVPNSGASSASVKPTTSLNVNRTPFLSKGASGNAQGPDTNPTTPLGAWPNSVAPPLVAVLPAPQVSAAAPTEPHMASATTEAALPALATLNASPSIAGAAPVVNSGSNDAATSLPVLPANAAQSDSAALMQLVVPTPAASISAPALSGSENSNGGIDASGGTATKLSSSTSVSVPPIVAPDVALDVAAPGSMSDAPLRTTAASVLPPAVPSKNAVSRGTVAMDSTPATIDSAGATPLAPSDPLATSDACVQAHAPTAPAKMSDAKTNPAPAAMPAPLATAQVDPQTPDALTPASSPSADAPPTAANIADPSAQKTKPDSSLPDPIADISSVQAAAGAAVTVQVATEQGAQVRPATNATSSKGATVPAAVGAAGRIEASRSHASLGAFSPMDQSQKGKEPVPSTTSMSADPQEVAVDSKAAAHNETSDDSNSSPVSTSGNSNLATLSSAVFPHVLEPLTTPAATQPDAATAATSLAAPSPTGSTPVPTPHAAAPSPSSTAPSSASPSGPATSTATLPDADGPQAHFVGNAKLVQAASHSEMRIAMDTDRLGPVELRARVVGDEIGAAITVEKRDAHAVLAVELPALQQALSDKQLRVDQVTLVHGSLHSTSGDGGEAARQQQNQRQAPAASATPWSSGSSRGLRGGSGFFYGSDSATIFDSQGRLSVHA